MAKPEKVYPSHVLADALRDRGISCRVLWEMRGPSPEIPWITGYLVNAHVVIVQTFTHDGWDAYTSAEINDVDATVADVILRCKMARVLRCESA